MASTLNLLTVYLCKSDKEEHKKCMPILYTMIISKGTIKSIKKLAYKKGLNIKRKCKICFSIKIYPQPHVLYAVGICTFFRHEKTASELIEK